MLGTLGVMLPGYLGLSTQSNNPKGNIMKIKAILAGAAITVAALACYPAQAHADPSDPGDARWHDESLMCSGIRNNPTIYGVEAVVEGWLAQMGTSDESAQLGADTLIGAVRDVCPQYAPVVAAWSDYRAKFRKAPVPPTPYSPPGTGGNVVNNI